MEFKKNFILGVNNCSICAITIIEKRERKRDDPKGIRIGSGTSLGIKIKTKDI